ncbi:MAG: UPF0175 family protein [Candidatus Aminicenantes bacterium]|nr:UPF0175 family protein [Candidatus Aminicenantes bacterium]
MTIEIPEAIVHTMKLPREQVKDYLLIDIAASLYKQGILSFGKARQLCEMSKWEFQRELGIRKIERHYEEKSLLEDIDFAYSNK